MKIDGFLLKKTAGLERVEVSGLSDVIVFAGPNGVGKTRLLRELIGFFQSPRAMDNLTIRISATTPLETADWGKNNIDSTNPDDCSVIRKSLQKDQLPMKYKSTVLNFDSDRAIINITPYNFSFDITDPLEKPINWNSSYAQLRDRFNDVQHSLFRLVQNHHKRLADNALAMQAAGKKEMLLDFADPLQPFKDAFTQLLAPKKLTEVNLREQKIYYEYAGAQFSLDSLSSGEKEVVNIVFDFLLRKPSDSIIFFDEPELHLHPELSYKLLQTLTAAGDRNQFVYSTHSPEIITASIENSVVFLSEKTLEKDKNQATLVNRDDKTHETLKLLGQSIGVISLGRKIILIEGEDSSLDKQVYGAILKNEFPEFALVPIGGKETLISFERISSLILDQSVWGVDFFMLCDRDAVNNIGPSSFAANQSPKLQALPRYHLENYFLDEHIISEIFRDLAPDSPALTDPQKVRNRLLEYAREAVPLAVCLKVSAMLREQIGNFSLMPKAIDKATTPMQMAAAFEERVNSELSRATTVLSSKGVGKLIDDTYSYIMQSIETDTGQWIYEVPCRQIIKRFCSSASMNYGYFRNLYISKARTAVSQPFAEIKAVFQSFRAGTPVG